MKSLKAKGKQSNSSKKSTPAPNAASAEVKQLPQDRAIDIIKTLNIEALEKLLVVPEGSETIPFINKFHSKSGKTCLTVAAEEGFIEIVKMLVNAKATIDLKDKNGLTPILYAAQAGEKNILEYLVDAGSDITITSKLKNENVLHLACRWNRVDTVVSILRYGINYSLLL